MDSLRAYLNSLPIADQTAYAKRCGTTIGYLRKALSIHRTQLAAGESPPKIDGGIVRKLWENSDRKVSRTELRPDIWPSPSRAPKEAA